MRKKTKQAKHKEIKIELGDEALDLVTKLEGVVTSMTKYMDSGLLLGIQPPIGEDGKMPEGYSIDVVQCVLVAKGTVKASDEKQDSTLKLGDEVVDTVTKLKGAITGRSDFLNGCIRFCVQPGLNKDGQIPGVEWFPPARLKLIKTAKEEVDVKTGGPMMALPPRY